MDLSMFMSVNGKKDHDAALHTVTFLKAIVSSSRSTLDEMVIDDGFAIMTSSGKVLLVWRKDDENWTPIEFEDQIFGDIVCRNEKFYALSIDGDFLSVHPKTLDVTKLANFCDVSLAFSALGRFSYLVNSSCTEEFFLIYRNYNEEEDHYDYDGGYDSENRTDDVYLFKLDIEKMVNVNDEDEENSDFNCDSNGEWIFEHEVDNLRGGMLFCSKFRSLFVSSAEEFPGCKKDCIYFNGESIFKMRNHCEGSKKLLDLPAGHANIFLATANLGEE